MFVYLDSVVIILLTFKPHLQILGKVMKRLTLSSLIDGLDKYGFCRPQLILLSYLVDKHRLRADVEKAWAILNIPVPTNLSEVWRFVGTAFWYRRFVPNFSKVIALLCELTKKNVQFHWFLLQCDASAHGLGGVLRQKFDDRKHLRSLTRPGYPAIGNAWL